MQASVTQSLNPQGNVIQVGTDPSQAVDPWHSVFMKERGEVSAAFRNSEASSSSWARPAISGRGRSQLSTGMARAETSSSSSATPAHCKVPLPNLQEYPPLPPPPKGVSSLPIANEEDEQPPPPPPKVLSPVPPMKEEEDPPPPPPQKTVKSVSVTVEEHPHPPQPLPKGSPDVTPSSSPSPAPQNFGSALQCASAQVSDNSPSAEAWEAYQEKEGVWWFSFPASYADSAEPEWFWENQAKDAGWTVYKDGSINTRWWWQEGTGRFFWDPRDIVQPGCEPVDSPPLEDEADYDSGPDHLDL
eukprot:gnl/MRDRNA2_/MRDRNA2_74442_c0_seq1.p1 gnl/MRDRNA2_/MRDRNA2_74442_c0~~gnl/MRDRNA2_/MRDRNA2_74442_c0_seq1.p1  ORF type:complete len:345 (+),score=62.74 gnl/MRDRNA2_/MRDRNA2_74442_c0_seq1:135-1037(+)